MGLSTAELQQKAQELQSKSAQDVLRWGLDTFADKIALSCSFQCEESVLIDMLFKLAGKNFRVFTLDTGRLNEETYEAMEDLRIKYGITIEAQFPDRSLVEKLEREKGLYSFRESIDNRKECCRIRKVEPLNRALSGLEAWITGLRAEQSVTRSEVAKVELNSPREGLVKLNPLIDWPLAKVWDYIRENKVPYNELHNRGYTSIGCEPCTRAIKPTESLRAGRWWWENPEQKECGLHAPKKR